MTACVRRPESSMYTVFIIGMAGSGKSLLTRSLAQFFQDEEQDTVIVNLDPGALTLPYSADIDIRDRINVTDIMDRLGLGPNGALVYAADLMATEIDKLREDVEETKASFVFVDTPGQMELFAFRPSGPLLASSLTDGPKAVVYLFDALFSSDPFNYVSNLFLAAALYTRFQMPQVHALTKIDLLPPEKVDEMVSWSEEPENLEAAIAETLKGERYLLTRDLVATIGESGVFTELIPVSSETSTGFADLAAACTRNLTGGEEILE
ncbi:MAG: ATP/GTP-binding protein [Candidatus Bathyarchaeia archaeon]